MNGKLKSLFRKLQLSSNTGCSLDRWDCQRLASALENLEKLEKEKEVKNDIEISTTQ